MSDNLEDKNSSLKMQTLEYGKIYNLHINKRCYEGVYIGRRLKKRLKNKNIFLINLDFPLDDTSVQWIMPIDDFYVVDLERHLTSHAYRVAHLTPNKLEKEFLEKLAKKF
jgi:hypothetical protein